MSNATQDSPNPGRKRRRRNRGGQNRNDQQNPQNRQGGHGGQRRDGDQNRDNRNNREGGDRHRDGGNRGPRERRPMPQPAKLTWWQKILKAIGLYKEPVRPTRQERIKETPAPVGGERKERTERPVKSNIRIARPQERKETERGPVESPRLYIGNLSYDVTEGDLTDLFKGIGGVRNVEIVYNRNTHRSKGYGFVEMLHVDDAKRSVEVFHDQPFMGRKLNVSGAKSKGFDEREEQEDRPDRQERRPRPAPVAAQVVAPAAAAAAVAVVAAATEAPAPAAQPEAVAEAAAPVIAEAEVTPVAVPAEVAQAPVVQEEVTPTAEAVATTEETVEEKTEEKHENA